MKIARCLSDLSITDASVFDECNDLDQELKVVKKSYLKLARTHHPDKGGDAANFRTIQTAWEVIVELHRTNKIDKGLFSEYLVSDGPEVDEHEVGDDFDDELYQKYANSTSVPSYEYYEEAAKEDVPGYKVELAKSGRSKCSKKDCGGKIDKDSIRVGSLDKVAGSYGRWHHLECWRVPKKVQNGLTNKSDEQTSLLDLLAMEEVLLTGVADLDIESKLLFTQHCLDRENWAGSGRKRKAPAIMGDNSTEVSADQGASKGPKVASKSESAPAAAKGNSRSSVSAGSFTVLVPQVDGAVGDDFLKGKTFVLAGNFPEVGGGDENAVGHANIKAMIQSFGGKVITRFSKNTNYLLVGQDAVTSRFTDATKRSIVIVNLRRLQGLLLGHFSVENLSNMDTLAVDAFKGAAYQAAGAAPPRPDPSQMQAIKSASASAASAKKPAAKKPAAKKPAVASTAIVPAAAAAAAAASSSSANASTAVVPHTGKKQKFVPPRPGVNGAVANVLVGKRFVTTGVFPELGGGAGLNLGKERMKALIESFGGRVTGSVSGKTDFVLVGKDPGRSKVSQADAKQIPLIDLLALQRLLLGQASIEDTEAAPPPRITNFSAGYAGQFRIEY